MSWDQLNQFLVKEHLGIFKAANNYDIFALDSGEQVLECREPNLGLITKLLRFTDYKRMTPFEIEIRDMQGNLVVTVKRGISIFLSKVSVYDCNNEYLGCFKQKLLSIGGKFKVLDSQDNEICMLKGNWSGWDFRFLYEDHELAHITKQWGGLGKELFTSADNYVLEMDPEIDPISRRLIFAAVMCIDMVLKE